jgi:DNA-binding MarR family transcriptional regulator
LSPDPRREAGAGPSDAVLSEEDLRIFARLLLHIGRQPRFGPLEQFPQSLTQGGMATTLRTTQAAVSNALGRLVDGGALRVERAHVRGKTQRLKVYQLTEQGEALVAHIRTSMSTYGDTRAPSEPSVLSSGSRRFASPSAQA